MYPFTCKKLRLLGLKSMFEHFAVLILQFPECYAILQHFDIPSCKLERQPEVLLSLLHMLTQLMALLYVGLHFCIEFFAEQ